MKIRIGYGLGTTSATDDPVRFGQLVDGLEQLGFDSLWLSERINATALDPTVAMTFAIARTQRLKVGTAVMVLPGRNPVVLAKAMASLDRLSAGRLLPAFGLGVAGTAEQQAFGVKRRERADWFDEALPLMRRLWIEEAVVHHGDRFHLDGARVLPKPVQTPLEVWLGGAADSELRRVGRLGDGWLASFGTPVTVSRGIDKVNAAAAQAGRSIDPEHFGVLLPYCDGELPARMVEIAHRRNPGVDPREIVPRREGLAAAIEAFIQVGASKFVVAPMNEPDDWTAELTDLAARVLPLEN